MTAIMSDFTLQNLTSTNIRAPYSTSEAPSMAESLPPLNFRFDDLRACMSDFTKRFDTFLEQGRRRVLEERNHFRIRVNEVQDQHTSTTHNIADLRSKSSVHAANLSAQATETKEMQAQIASLTSTRDAHLATVNALRTRLAGTKGTLNAKKTAQKQERQYLEHQASFNAPEIRAWEEVLGMRIEALGVEDRVRFVFHSLDRKDRQGKHGQWGRDREAFFDLDMSAQGGSGYEIVECRPRLDGEAQEACLRVMREKEDLRAFLKRMRELFVAEFAR